MIITAADLGGGQVIVVDPDNAGLVSWYAANGFLSIGAPDLRMCLRLARPHLPPMRPAIRCAGGFPPCS
jgi:hypothetical protein